MRFVHELSAVVQKQRLTLTLNSLNWVFCTPGHTYSTQVRHADATQVGAATNATDRGPCSKVQDQRITWKPSSVGSKSKLNQHKSRTRSGTGGKISISIFNANQLEDITRTMNLRSVTTALSKTTKQSNKGYNLHHFIFGPKRNISSLGQKFREPPEAAPPTAESGPEWEALEENQPKPKIFRSIRRRQSEPNLVNKHGIPLQKFDIKRLMASEDEWIVTGTGHRVHAWSISGIESCIVTEIAGTRFAFDMGYATRPSIQCAHVFISHGHIDHISSVVKHAAHRSLFSLPPATYYMPPHLEKPLQAMANSFRDLGNDDEYCNLKIKPVNPGEIVQVTKSIKVLAFPTVHRVPSQGYIVYRTKKCLKEEYVGRPGPEIGALVKEGVDIHEVVTQPELAYTGDTTFEVFSNPPTEDLFKVRTLITESTYIDNERDKYGRDGVQRARERGHSHLQEHIDNEELFKDVGHIVFVHFSDKYSVRYIRRQTEEILTEGLKKKVSFGIHMKESLG